MSIFNHNIYANLRTRVIVIHEDNLLLLEPAQASDGWRLPGGGLEPDESIYECGERELQEETGLEIHVTGVAFLREWVVPKYCVLPEAEGSHGFGLEVHLYASLIGPAHPLHREYPDAQMPHWISLDQVGSLPIWPKEIKPLIRTITSGNPLYGVLSYPAHMEDPHTSAPDVAFNQRLST